MESLRADEVLDARGLECPATVLQAKSLLLAMRPGQILEVRADDPASQENLAAFVGRSGDEMLGCFEQDGYVSIFLRRA